MRGKITRMQIANGRVEVMINNEKRVLSYEVTMILLGELLLEKTVEYKTFQDGQISDLTIQDT